MEFLSALLPFVVVLSFLVFVHEWGHYIVARFYGVAVEVFSIGFGREIYGFHDRHGTRWRFALVPLGGYVRFFGDMDETSGRQKKDISSDERQKTFHGKKAHQRIMILLAGPVANLAAAWLLLLMLLLVSGEHFLRPVISDVMEGSAAQEAGLQKGDRFVSINNTPINSFADLSEVNEWHEGQPMDVRVLRDNTEMKFRLAPRMMQPEGESQPRLMLGVIGSEWTSRPLDVSEALGMSVTQSVAMFGAVLNALGELLSGSRTLDQLGGPVQIAQISGDRWERGFDTLIHWMAFISINLAIFNLLPLPPLDGGHILFTSIEAVRRRPVSEEILYKIQAVGILFVLTLFLYVTWNDTMRWWNG